MSNKICLLFKIKINQNWNQRLLTIANIHLTKKSKYNISRGTISSNISY